MGNNKALTKQSKTSIKDYNYSITLIGNPNTGKSTIFNSLTGMNQHTGNWTGKTVENAYGVCVYDEKKYLFVDLPGTYSLLADSEEEKISRNYIKSNVSDLVVIVVDATRLERNLNLVYQIFNLTNKVIVCVNLLDEAEKKGIKIDLSLLSQELGVPVVGTIAKKPQTMINLLNTIAKVCDEKIIYNPIKPKDNVENVFTKSKEVIQKVCSFSNYDYNQKDKKIDKILTSKKFGIPIMVVFLCIIFWITIVGANYPSNLLSSFFSFIKPYIEKLLTLCHTPNWLFSLFIDGIYSTVTWIISVMLPPMAIFFPIFTLLEDLGFLPRISFNLDKCFHKCNTSGKQALTMCMVVTSLYELIYFVVTINEYF